MEAYFTERDWGILCDGQRDLTCKFRVAAHRCITLGLAYPSEGTIVHIIGIVLLAHHAGLPNALAVRPIEVLGMIKDFKCLIKAERKAFTHFICGVELYPATPEELKQLSGPLYEQGFSDEPPCKSQLDELELASLVASLPARWSHKSLSPGKLQAERTAHMEPMAVMAQMFAHLVTNRGLGMQGTPEPPVRFLSPRLRALGAAAAAASDETLSEPGSVKMSPAKAPVEQLLAPVSPKHCAMPVPAMGDATTECNAPVATGTSQAPPSNNLDAPLDEGAIAAPLAVQGKDVSSMAQALIARLNGKQGLPKKRVAPTMASKLEKPAKKREASAVGSKPSFPGTGYRAPWNFRGCTIYTSTSNRCWRVKVRPGDRHDKAFSFKRQPAENWAALVAYCIENGDGAPSAKA